MAKVTILYGKGDPKKHSVRYAHVDGGSHHFDALKVSDIYVSRDILDEIGATDKSTIRVTYEKVDD